MGEQGGTGYYFFSLVSNWRLHYGLIFSHFCLAVSTRLVRVSFHVLNLTKQLLIIIPEIHSSVRCLKKSKKIHANIDTSSRPFIQEPCSDQYRRQIPHFQKP